MKAAFLCCILLLAGSVSCGPVEGSKITLPESVPEWIADLIGQIPENVPEWIGDLIGQIPENVPEWIGDLIGQLPDSIQEIIDRLPEIIEAIPAVLDRIQEIVATIIDRIPEVIPIILERLEEIIAQIPAILEQVPGFIEQIINSIPEYIPIVLDRIPQVIAAIPGLYERIQEYIESLGLPDWVPTLPDLEAPEWWPEELPTLPEYNQAVLGTETSVEEYPSIVQIEVGAGPVWIQGCAGVVLTSMHVLSSARCFSGGAFNIRFRRVRAGSSSRYTDGSIVSVESAVNHPSFGENSFDGDISVVRLGGNLVFGSTIQQGSIVSSGFELPSGLGVKLAGFGSTAQGQPYANPNLYEIDLSVIDQDACTTSWARIPLLSITDNTLCVGRSETGGRNGDIRDMGAPVYYDGIVVGVVSVGVPVGNQVFPVVTTKVSAYTDWVVANAV